LDVFFLRAGLGKMLYGGASGASGDDSVDLRYDQRKLQYVTYRKNTY
jgi:hypothetical protein